MALTMAKITAKQVAHRKRARRGKKALIWVGVVAVVGAIGYGIATSSGVRYDESDIAVVDFSMLNPTQKRTALVAANAARCTCGCGLTLAGCVVTDMTCPVRNSNIDRIEKIVADTLN